MLLPSQAIKAIDRQRKDLVAYEYLCHLAECVFLRDERLLSSTDPL